MNRTTLRTSFPPGVYFRFSGLFQSKNVEGSCRVMY